MFSTPAPDPFTDPPTPELSDGRWFSDPPTLPELQGLQHGECHDCGGHALVDAQYVGAVRCSACWSRFHKPGGDFVAVPLRSAPRSYVVKPWISQGERGAPRSGTAEPAEAAASRWRIITPARPVDDEFDDMPQAAVRLAAGLAGEEQVAVTYALAEDLKLGRLIESIAVRVPHVGYAIWQRSGDGSWTTHAAQIADPLLRNCSVTEFSALVTGKPWTPPAPPITGPCPRCQTVVRWKKDPFEPYAHNRPGKPKEAKTKCLPNA